MRESVLEKARADVRARLVESLGGVPLPEVEFATGPRGVEPTIARCLDGLYRLDGGLTVGQWCVMRTFVRTLLDHLDEVQTSDDQESCTIPLRRIP